MDGYKRSGSHRLSGSRLIMLPSLEILAYSWCTYFRFFYIIVSVLGILYIVLGPDETQSGLYLSRSSLCALVCNLRDGKPNVSGSERDTNINDRW